MLIQIYAEERRRLLIKAHLAVSSTPRKSMLQSETQAVQQQ